MTAYLQYDSAQLLPAAEWQFLPRPNNDGRFYRATTRDVRCEEACREDRRESLIAARSATKGTNAGRNSSCQFCDRILRDHLCQGADCCPTFLPNSTARCPQTEIAPTARSSRNYPD